VNYNYVGHNGSEDTCLHQVVAQEGLQQHTQEPQAARCLRKAVMHSTHLDNDKKQYTKHVQSSEHKLERTVKTQEGKI
jgi:hypothetical protein